MSDAYLGEIRLFGGNFAPVHWQFCDGQLLSISQYEGLFSLLGAVYGGDGRSTFGLPDLRGRIPVHSGDSNGPGLPAYPLGMRGGQETHAVTVNEMPAHSHAINAMDDVADSGSPYMGTPAITIGSGSNATNLYGTYDQSTASWMAEEAMANGGQNEAHQNMMPSMAISFIICIQGGGYPPRN